MQIYSVKYIHLSSLLNEIPKDSNNLYANFDEEYSDNVRLTFGDNSHSLVNKDFFLKDIKSWLPNDDYRLEIIIIRLRKLGDDVFIDLES